MRPIRLLATKAIAIGFVAISANTIAADVCEFPVDEVERNPAGTRIARIACDEHALWLKPFIDAHGRVIRLGPMEAERDKLGDGRTQAWQRVLHYWRESGLLARRNHVESIKAAQSTAWLESGARDCAVEAPDWRQRAACRTFLIDVPWSSVFVSYVMKKADFAEFAASSSHYYYLRDAGRNPKHGLYRMVELHAEKPRVGDLVCYLREKNRILDYAEFAAHWLENNTPLDSHCDIVVGVDLNGDSKLYAIGGNVVQGVTMRKLNLNARGFLSPPMKKNDGDTRPASNRENAIHFNRQNWIALLKLNR
jgi:hypothetical protein